MGTFVVAGICTPLVGLAKRVHRFFMAICSESNFFLVALLCLFEHFLMSSFSLTAGAVVRVVVNVVC